MYIKTNLKTKVICTNKNLFLSKCVLGEFQYIEYAEPYKPDGSFEYEEITEEEYQSLFPQKDALTEHEPTEQELIQAEILLNQAEIIAKQKEQDEVLAELLLGQQEVATNV